MKIIEKKLILGTALWGWCVNKNEAFSILDNFTNLGGNYIDCATNYPINKNINDYGLALKWLEEWNKINNLDLFIIIKIGSLDNLGSPSYDISKNRIQSISEGLFHRFGCSLGCISIHWDNRVEEKHSYEVKETLSAFKELKEKGISIGLSGIKNPLLYYNAMPELSNDWIIQCKENLLTNEIRLNYEEYFPLSKYYAYGINMGGLKISENEKSVSAKIRKIDYSDKLKLLILNCLNDQIIKSVGLRSSNDLNLAFIYINQRYHGVIVGPRTVEQLISTFETWNKLVNLDLNSIELLKSRILKLYNMVKLLDK